MGAASDVVHSNYWLANRKTKLGLSWQKTCLIEVTGPLCKLRRVWSPVHIDLTTEQPEY